MNTRITVKKEARNSRNCEMIRGWVRVFRAAWHLCVLVHVGVEGEVGTVKLVKSSCNLLTDHPRLCFFCGSFFVICVCL